MSAERFTSFLPHLRDRGMPLLHSWCKRHRDEGDDVPHDTAFNLWSLKPLEALTTEDLLWFLVAAASNPFSTCLQLHVFLGDSRRRLSPIKIFQSLIDDLVDELGFDPSDEGYYFDDDGDSWFMLSLFSSEEREHISELLGSTGN